MHSIIVEERPDDPRLRDSYMPTPTATEPTPKRSSSSLSTTSATLLPTPEKTHAVHTSSVVHPPSPHSLDHDPDSNDNGSNPFDTDLEAIIPTDSARCCRSKTRSDNQVWPGKEHWRQKAKEAKRAGRMCACMGSLSRRTRIAVKIAIGLLIVGIAVAVGFGVSKPLGAPIWGDNTSDR